ncbi:Golgi apyrase [Linnemannia exigua]|uniref:Golgi apyrase n=1 Tax=Linnemannia exigua TaxID=604196 RepID=A0AAD4DK01_9FUNG|nr:Golgi apyrase [Linnemannia exigua]
MTTPIHSDDWIKNRQFGIVIDAGSSGSRLHIYSWINRNHILQTTPHAQIAGVLPTIEPGVESDSEHAAKWSTRTVPGIAEFKDRPDDVGEHLEPLLDHALKIIPESEIARTPIYVFATAGLRLVQDDIREQILANSCNYIRDNYKFHMGECKNHIKNISGEEEGIYGWVAINYLMGGFDNGGVKMIKPEVSDSELHSSDDSLSVPSVDSHGSGKNSQGDDDNFSHRHTLGFLDMGGASTQIAFEPSPEASRAHANDLMAVHLRTLDGHTLEYNVFVTTFLGYGSNQARRRYVKDYLVANNKELLEEGESAALTPIEDPCLPKRLQLSETHTMPHVPLVGSGSFQECLKKVEVLLNKDKECHDEPCLFNGVHTPPIDFNINTFIGVSEYWYSSHDILGLDYQDQAQERLEMQCFKSAWMSNVLHGGFGLPRFGEKGALGSEEQSNEVLEKAEESIKKKNWRPPFQSINAIKDIQVTWTLGAMLLISSGSLDPPNPHLGGEHHLPSQILPPADHKAPHEDTYPERMLDSYNHFMLLAIVLFGLAIFWVYRSRSSKTWPTIRRWLGSGGPLSPGGSGGSGGGLPFFGRFRRTSGPSNADYSALESGTAGSATTYGRGFGFKVFYLSVVHHTRSVWWSITSRLWPEPRGFDPLDGQPGEMIEAITIAGYDGNSSTTNTMPLVGITGHHGGTPAGSFGTSGLNTIPEGGNGSIGGNGNGAGGMYDQNYHRSPSHQSGAARGPPKTKPNFFRMNKKRFSGDSQSLFGNKNGPGNVGADGCVVNTALLQKQTMNSVELTARTASSTNLSGLWNNNNSNSSVPNSINNPEQPSGTGSWKQGWIPEEEADEVPMPSLLSTSRSYNTVINSSGQSPLLTPMARYKLQHQEGSSSAPSSTVNLGAALLQNQGHNSGFVSSSGFVTSADEREEWSADGGDGDDEGEGYMDRRPSGHSTTNSIDHKGFQQYQQNQQQYTNQPFRSASAVPFSSSSPRSYKSHHHPHHYQQQQQTQQQQQSSPTVPTIGSRYKQRSTGLLSGINFDTGGGAMTSIDAGQESAGEAGYQSGSSTGHGPSVSSGRFGSGSAAVPGGVRSGSPMIANLQQASTSTSSLVLGRHNVSEQDQQLVSRGSSENLRRGSMGTAMSP